MIALKEKADKDLLQYNMELKELIRIIDHDRKLKEFMRVKGEERADLADKELGMKQRKKETEKDKGDREETVEVILIYDSIALFNLVFLNTLQDVVHVILYVYWLIQKVKAFFISNLFFISKAYFINYFII